MNATRSNNRFHPFSIAIHWLTLVLLAVVYALIELRKYYPKGSEIREGLKTWHFIFGLTVFAIVLIRIVVRLMHRAPPITPKPPVWTWPFREGMHLALYLFLIAMPILGWMTLSAKGKTIPFWGLHLPPIHIVDKALAKQLEATHATIAYVGLALIALHTIAALIHHYILRDDALTRMLPERKG